MSELDDDEKETKFKTTKRTLKVIDKKIEELESLVKRPKQFVCDYFSQLEKTIELKRDEDKQKLDLYYKNILKVIRINKKELEEKLTTTTTTSNQVESNSKTNVYIDYLNDWITEYNLQYKRDKNAPLENIIFESNLFKLKLDQQILNAKKFIFNGMNYEVNANELTLKLKLPSIKITKLEQNDSFDLVRFKLKNFKQFQIQKKSMSKSYETGNVKWKFYVENDLEEYISCYIQINLDIVKDKCIEAEFQVELVHPDENKRNFSKWSHHSFKTDKLSEGWSKFINLKDLIKYKYCSDSDDSITFEIFINFKNNENTKNK